MKISKEFISSVSVNEAAVKNGVDLVRKKSFGNCIVDKNKTFIAGECAGSGKTPYLCSADFINEEAPVFRCTCPSRQIPCKHVIGLMWAYAEGHRFAVAEIPEDIIQKRENKEKRAARAKEKAEQAENSGGAGDGTSEPREKTASWKRSAVKKIEAQLTGLDEASKILTGLAGAGLASMDAKNLNNFMAAAKQLESYFIPGIQKEIDDLLGMMNDAKSSGGQDIYMDASEKLCRIYAVLVRAKAYLEKKKKAPDIMDTESEIEELTGYAWKLEELAQHGLLESDARLVQLCFHVRQEDDKNQFVDEGFFISLGSRKIYKTRNYRPYKALKYIREEDSVFGVLNIKKLHIYPSMSLNPRVRWEDNVRNSYDGISHEEYKQIKACAHTDFAEVIKTVKNQLKNIYLFPHPALLVGFERLAKLPGSKSYAIYDPSGNAICLRQSSYCQDSFIYLLEHLTGPEAEKNAMLLLFENDAGEGELFAQPLALVTDEKILRLVY